MHPPHMHACALYRHPTCTHLHTHTHPVHPTPPNMHACTCTCTLYRHHTHTYTFPKFQCCIFPFFPCNTEKLGDEATRTCTHTHTHSQFFNVTFFFLQYWKAGGHACTHTHTHTHLRNTTSKNSAQKRWCSSLTQFLEANIHKPLAPSKIMYVLYP